MSKSNKTFETEHFLILKEHRFFSNHTRKPFFDRFKKGFFSVNLNDGGEHIKYMLSPALAYARQYGWGKRHESYRA